MQIQMAIYRKGTQADRLMEMARTNVERSECLIARTETAMGRWVAVRRDAARVHPQCRRLSTEGRNDSSVPSGIKNWLLAIASVIKDWPTILKDAIDVTLAEATPAEAAAYIVNLHVPRDVREDVLRALPPLTKYSFHHAAWQIRKAAALQDAG